MYGLAMVGIKDDEMGAGSVVELAEALAAGRARYCSVCDGYEVIDRVVGVVGTDEALCLRSFTPYVTLVVPKVRTTCSRSNMRG